MYSLPTIKACRKTSVKRSGYMPSNSSRKSSSTVSIGIGTTSTNGLPGKRSLDLVIMASNLPELERRCICLHVRDSRETAYERWVTQNRRIERKQVSIQPLAV